MFVIFNRYNKLHESLKVKNDIIEKVGIDNIRNKQRGTRDEIAPPPPEDRPDIRKNKIK